MTITPVAAPAAKPAVGTSGGTLGGDFESLVQQHLAEDSAGSSDLPRKAASAILEAASAASAVPSDGLARLLAGLLAAPTPTPAPASVAAPQAAGPAVDETTPSGTPAATVAGEVPILAAAGPTTVSAIDGQVDAGPGEPSARVVAQPDVPGPQAGAVSCQTAPAAGAEVSVGGSSRSHPVVSVGEPTQWPASAVGGIETSGATESDRPTGTGTTSSGSTGAPTVTAAGAPAAAGSTPVAAPTPIGATTTESALGVRVADQVFEPVSRLVTRGDGTHRLTLRLHPADLGEVKVVLSAKDGNIEVTVSGGPEACEALREGSSRLRSLLELAGASSGTVVVRELGSGALVSSTGVSQQAGLATGSDGGFEAGRHGAGDHEADGSARSADERGTDDHSPTRSRAAPPGTPDRLGSRSSLDIDM